MALRDGQKRVGRAVHIHDADGRIRPGIITALGAGDAVSVRVGHHGETYSDVALMTAYDEVETWYAASRRQFEPA